MREVDDSEVLFLVLHFLKGISCAEAACVLETEASAHGLLPKRTDVFGQQHLCSYSELQSRYQHVPATALRELLQKVLHAKQQTSPGLGTLLGAGSHSCIDGSAVPLFNRSLSWLRKPHDQAPLLPKLMLRETGMAVHSLVDAQTAVKHIRHQRTFRGHRLAVYSVAYDKAGRRLVTGADDCLVKIWSAHTGLLLKSCRGHEAEITHLGVSSDNSMVASACMDKTIRVWSLEDETVGHPVSVLLGHQGPVTFLSFSPTLPNALLSASFDGTCRIWNARDGASAAIVLKPSPVFGPMSDKTRGGGTGMPSRLQSEAGPSSQRAHASQLIGSQQQEPPAGPQDTGFTCCSFSPDSTFIIAGGKDCNAYLWRWDVSLPNAAASRGRLQRQDGQGGSFQRAAAAVQEWDPKDSVKPAELVKLVGHKNDINFVEFSRDGHAVATAARDGSVRIWRQVKSRGKFISNWREALALACPPDEEEVKKARLRRKPPPHLSINQVAWSLDDRYVIAAVTDNSIRVWDAESGSLIHLLREHTQQAHVLEVHPFNRRLLMTGGYDGQTILWDIEQGIKLRSFSTTDTFPGRGRWTDVLQLVDGHFSPDGGAIVVSDVAGQFHIYAADNGDSMAFAPYDQFLTSDYDGLIRDLNQYVIDASTQQPPHLMTHQLLCNIANEAYDETMQMAYRRKQLQGVVPRVQKTDPLPRGLANLPPTVTAAQWQATEDGASDNAVHTAMVRAFDRHREAMEALERGEEMPRRDAAAPAIRRPARHAPAAARQRAAPAPTQAAATTRQPARQQAARAASTAYLGPANDSGDSDGSGSNSEESDAESEGSDEEGMALRPANRLRRRRGDDKPGHASRRAGARTGERPGSRAAGRLSGRKRPRYEEPGESDLDEEEEDVEDEAEDEARAQRRARRDARRNKTTKKAHKAQRQRSIAAPAGAARGALRTAPTGRTLDKYAWLQRHRQQPDCYVPQLGDEVVYIRDGHEAYFDHQQDKRSTRPWQRLRGGQQLRPAEPCVVRQLDYQIAGDGTYNTVARLRLELVDSASACCGQSFTVELPHPASGCAEFVVLRTRFDAAVRKVWRIGERCKTYQLDSPESNEGQWWTGMVIEDRLNSTRGVLSDPYGTPGLWERYGIRWSAADGGEDDEAYLSPWELVEYRASWEDLCARDSRLSADETEAVEAALDKLIDEPRFELFASTPEPDESYPFEDGGGEVYYNALIELPLSLHDMRTRLADGYYRSLEAVRHDLNTIVKNCIQFNGDDSLLTADAQIMEAMFAAALVGEPFSTTDQDLFGLQVPRRVRKQPRRPSRTNFTNLLAVLPPHLPPAHPDGQTDNRVTLEPHGQTATLHQPSASSMEQPQGLAANAQAPTVQPLVPLACPQQPDSQRQPTPQAIANESGVSGSGRRAPMTRKMARMSDQAPAEGNPHQQPQLPPPTFDLTCRSLPAQPGLELALGSSGLAIQEARSTRHRQQQTQNALGLSPEAVEPSRLMQQLVPQSSGLALPSTTQPMQLRQLPPRGTAPSMLQPELYPSQQSQHQQPSQVDAESLRQVLTDYGDVMTTNPRYSSLHLPTSSSLELHVHSQHHAGASHPQHSRSAVQLTRPGPSPLQQLIDGLSEPGDHSLGQPMRTRQRHSASSVADISSNQYNALLRQAVGQSGAGLHIHGLPGQLMDGYNMQLQTRAASSSHRQFMPSGHHTRQTQHPLADIQFHTALEAVNEELAGPSGSSKPHVKLKLRSSSLSNGHAIFHAPPSSIAAGRGSLTGMQADGVNDSLHAPLTRRAAAKAHEAASASTAPFAFAPSNMHTNRLQQNSRQLQGSAQVAAEHAQAIDQIHSRHRAQSGKLEERTLPTLGSVQQYNTRSAVSHAPSSGLHNLPASDTAPATRTRQRAPSTQDMRQVTTDLLHVPDELPNYQDTVRSTRPAAAGSIDAAGHYKLQTSPGITTRRASRLNAGNDGLTHVQGLGSAAPVLGSGGAPTGKITIPLAKNKRR